MKTRPQETAKRGRPPKAEKIKTTRLSQRVPDHLATQIESAAAWRGMSISAFIIEAARREAERVIEQENVIRLKEEEWNTMRELIENPPKATPHARKAAAAARLFEIRS